MKEAKHITSVDVSMIMFFIWIILVFTLFMLNLYEVVQDFDAMAILLMGSGVFWMIDLVIGVYVDLKNKL